MRLDRRIIGCLCGLAIGAQIAPAQGPQVVVIDREYEIKAKYLYFLAAFVEPTPVAAPAAPPTVVASRAALQIAVIGERKSANEKLFETAALDQYKKLKDAKGERAVKWIHFKKLEDFQSRAAEPWHIVFLLEQPLNEIGPSLEKVNQLTQETVAGAPRGRQLLIVTEQNDSFRRLATANLYEDQSANRVRIQIRQASLDERRLKANAQFLSSSAVVKN